MDHLRLKAKIGQPEVKVEMGHYPKSKVEIGRPGSKAGTSHSGLKANPTPPGPKVETSQIGPKFETSLSQRSNMLS